jgi:hypothetical protein
MRLDIAIALAALSIGLSGCGTFDSEAYWFPESFRAKKYEPAAPDPEPDAAAFVKDHQSEIFFGEVSDVKVGRPKPNGLQWEFCVFGLVKGVTGVTSEATIVVETRNGRMESRRRATAMDNCEFG